MSTNVALDASLVLTPEFLAKMIKDIDETTHAAKKVIIGKDSINGLSSFMKRIVPFLEELGEKDVENPEIFGMLNKLHDQIKLSKLLVLECQYRNKVYLLINCREIVRKVDDTTKEISRILSRIPVLSVDLSLNIRNEMIRLCEAMSKTEYKMAIEEEQALHKIELAMNERNTDSQATTLLNLISNAIGIPSSCLVLKREIEELKREIDDSQLGKGQAKTIQMAQIISLLERIDTTLSPNQEKIMYLQTRRFLGCQPLDPLQSFVCPITRDVMNEPVEAESGHTFERSAIEKWLDEGHDFCPATNISIDRGSLRPNISLRKSIEEWKERNTMIMFISLKSKLFSLEDSEVLHGLCQILELCEEKELHRRLVVLEDYVPVLFGCIKRKSIPIRIKVLEILLNLAKNIDIMEEKNAEVENYILCVEQCLSRSIQERKLAAALLLELSKSSDICKYIAKAQGCIVLLVAALNCDGEDQFINGAEQVLENIASMEENVIVLAGANYFRPLLKRLSSGSDDVKLKMLTSLNGMELTDNSKSKLFEDGALDILLHIISDSDGQVREEAVNSLLILSKPHQNGLQMIRAGAMSLLIKLLSPQMPSNLSLKEPVAAIIMNLARCSLSEVSVGNSIILLQSDDDIYMLLSLVGLSRPCVQSSILQAFHCMCQHPSQGYMRVKLRQFHADQALVKLCESEFINPSIHLSALKLLFSLTKDEDNAWLTESADHRFSKILLKIITSSQNEEEKSFAMGVIANLPMDSPEITSCLLKAGIFKPIIEILTKSTSNELIEHSVRALCRCIVPANLQYQRNAAESGVISVLIRLLRNGTSIMKQYAAISLTHFSHNSKGLSAKLERKKGFFCFSQPSDIHCIVHGGLCSEECSFCLVEAGGVEPLIKLLDEKNSVVCEAALQALSTLIIGESLSGGAKVIDSMNGITPIIKSLCSRSESLQEEALNFLEKIFHLSEYTNKYGASALMYLVDITQRGNSRTKSLAAGILASLSVIPKESSYF